MKKQRNSSIELLRIISMASVVGHHFLKWGGVLDLTEFGSAQYIIFWLFNGLFFTCVNCFMLITGYFLCESRMKLSRLVRFWSQVLFYSLVCTVAMMIVQRQVSLTTLAKALVPLTSQQYWYATQYALILCFTPLLNRLVGAMTKRQYQEGLLILFLVMSLMPTLLVWERDLLTSGRDCPWMIVLYLTGGYIRKYGLRLNRKQSFIGFAVCVLVTGLARTPLGFISQKLIGSEVLSGLFFRYNSITVYLGSVLLFNAMRQKESVRLEKPVLALAPLSFAVYLIHENPSVRRPLWAALPIDAVFGKGILATLGMLVLVVAGFVLAGCGVEWLRLALFRLCGAERLYARIDRKSASKSTETKAN